MALGLSVIFGVVRVVNFAHGEMMTIAMYIAIVLFQAFKLDPLVMMVPIAGALFALGYVMQVGLINPFVDRPEHSQFMLLVAVALIMVNMLLLVFGPDARSVQTSYAFDSFAFGRSLVDAGGARRRRADRHDRGARGAAVHAVGEKHVRVRDPCAGAAVPPPGNLGEARVMNLLEGIPKRALILIAALLAALIAAPLFAND